MKSETLVEGKADGQEKTTDSEKAADFGSPPRFSKTTKWTLLGLFSLGLFIDVYVAASA